jgi:hypothetical protein
MIRILVKFIINSEGESPSQLVERLRPLGGSPLSGEYDVEVPLGDGDRVFAKLDSIHAAMKGSRAHYSIMTSGGDAGEGNVSKEGMPNVPLQGSGDQPLIDAKKNMYRAKLARWREMGLDTGHLEVLLDTDIEKFREESRNFLRDHLDKHKVVEDAVRDLKTIDEEVYGKVDAKGTTLSEICQMCRIDENEAILSLGRLMSVGKIVLEIKDGVELYSRARHIVVTLSEKSASQPETPSEGGPAPVGTEEKVFDAIKRGGSTLKQVCADSGLPEEEVLGAISWLINGGRVRTSKKGKNAVYTKVKAT